MRFATASGTPPVLEDRESFVCEEVLAMARRRNRDGMLKLYAAGENHERRVIMFISSAKGQRMLNDKTATMVFEEDGDFLGIRKCDSAYKARKANAPAPVITEEMMSGCVVLSRAEVESLADRSVSRTARLTEEQRDARVSRGLPEMDLAESARVKFQTMFPSRPNFASQSA
jgi:hypothetical protein